MKVKFLLIACSLISVLANAQQQPFYTQYFLNPFISNPALAGIENYWDVKTSYRNQWQGIDGAPRTTYFTIQGPLRRIQYSKATTGTVAPPGKKELTAKYWMQYKAIVAHPGLGLTIMNDKTGPINRYVVSATYAYHIGLTSKTSISAGLSGGIQGISLNTNQLNFGLTNPNDPSVSSEGVASQIKPIVSSGIWLYSAFYFAGISVQDMIPSRLGYSNYPANSVLLVPHLMLTAGYKFLLSEDISLLPSTMIRFVNDTPISFDLNSKLQFRDQAWVGGSYRHNEGFAAMVGLNINSTLNVGYSYDIITSRLHPVVSGTHEIVLGFLIGNRNRVLCPRDFW